MFIVGSVGLSNFKHTSILQPQYCKHGTNRYQYGKFAFNSVRKVTSLDDKQLDALHLYLTLAPLFASSTSGFTRQDLLTQYNNIDSLWLPIITMCVDLYLQWISTGARLEEAPTGERHSLDDSGLGLKYSIIKVLGSVMLL